MQSALTSIASTRAEWPKWSSPLLWHNQMCFQFRKMPLRLGRNLMPKKTTVSYTRSCALAFRGPSSSSSSYKTSVFTLPLALAGLSPFNRLKCWLCKKLLYNQSQTEKQLCANLISKIKLIAAWNKILVALISMFFLDLQHKDPWVHKIPSDPRPPHRLSICKAHGKLPKRSLWSSWKGETPKVSPSLPLLLSPRSHIAVYVVCLKSVNWLLAWQSFDLRDGLLPKHPRLFVSCEKKSAGSASWFGLLLAGGSVGNNRRCRASCPGL